MTPQGWKKIKLGDAIEFLEAGTSVNSEDRPIRKGEFGVLKISAVTYGTLDVSQHKTVLPSELNRVSGKLQRDTILISRANTIELVGASVYVEKDYENLFLPDKLWAATSKNDAVIIKWLSYLLASPSMRVKISNIATGTSGSMKNITKPSLLDLEFLLPPLPEQRKIAEILSTWDEVIAQTERLLAVLRERKKGLMQWLMTGQVRFAGFDGEWKEMRLEEIALDFINGGTPSTTIGRYWQGNIPWVSSADFGELRLNRIYRFITEEAVQNSATHVVKEGTILIVTRVGVGKLAIAPCDIAFSQDTTAVIPNNEIIRTDFLLYALGWTIPNMLRYNQGTSINGVMRKDLKQHVFLVPSLLEQEKISTVLQDCDSEIDLYVKKLEALKQQKKGLMQRLLTGLLRVNHMLGE